MAFHKKNAQHALRADIQLISFTIRLDDPGLRSNHSLERRILDLLHQHGLCATVAVIPAYEKENGPQHLDTQSAAHLIEAQQAGTIEIAQHGFAHVARSQVTAGKYSEFVGLPPAGQHLLIDSGKRILEQVFQTNISGFVPPWNTYDQSTLKALAQSGFSYFSAGWEYIGYDPSIASLPRTCQITELQHAIKLARRFEAYSPHIIAVLHHYDFKEEDPASGRISLDDFESLLAWLATQPGLSCKTLATMVAEIRHDEEAWLSFHQNRARLPYFLRKRMPHQMLMKTSMVQTLFSSMVS